MSFRSWLFGLTLFAGVTLTARGASAQPHWADSYNAPAGCPDRSWFESELSARLPDQSVGTRVHVFVKAQKGGFLGRVQRSGSRAEGDTREVTHPSCEQVVRALALIAAVFLDEDPQPPASTSIHPPSTPRRPRPEPERDQPFSAARPVFRLAHGPRLSLALQSSIAPDLRAGPRLGYRLLAGRTSFALELDIGVTRTSSGTLTVNGVGSANLTYTAGRLAACPVFRLRPSWWLGPCASVDIGQLRGSGTVIGEEPVARTSGWLSPGLLAKLEWRPVGPLFIELAAGAVLPLRRPEFYFAQQQGSVIERRIYKTPDGLGFSSDLALGLLFQ